LEEVGLTFEFNMNLSRKAKRKTSLQKVKEVKTFQIKEKKLLTVVGLKRKKRKKKNKCIKG